MRKDMDVQRADLQEQSNMEKIELQRRLQAMIEAHTTAEREITRVREGAKQQRMQQEGGHRSGIAAVVERLMEEHKKAQQQLHQSHMQEQAQEKEIYDQEMRELHQRHERGFADYKQSKEHELQGMKTRLEQEQSMKSKLEEKLQKMEQLCQGMTQQLAKNKAILLLTEQQIQIRQADGIPQTDKPRRKLDRRNNAITTVARADIVTDQVSKIKRFDEVAASTVDDSSSSQSSPSPPLSTLQISPRPPSRLSASYGRRPGTPLRNPTPAQDIGPGKSSQITSVSETQYPPFIETQYSHVEETQYPQSSHSSLGHDSLSDRFQPDDPATGLQPQRLSHPPIANTASRLSGRRTPVPTSRGETQRDDSRRSMPPPTSRGHTQSISTSLVSTLKTLGPQAYVSALRSTPIHHSQHGKAHSSFQSDTSLSNPSQIVQAADDSPPEFLRPQPHPAPQKTYGQNQHVTLRGGDVSKRRVSESNPDPRLTKKSRVLKTLTPFLPMNSLDQGNRGNSRSQAGPSESQIATVKTAQKSLPPKIIGAPHMATNRKHGTLGKMGLSNRQTRCKLAL